MKKNIKFIKDGENSLKIPETPREPKRIGTDHFRHAFNYGTMARQSSPQLLFPQFQ